MKAITITALLCSLTLAGRAQTKNTASPGANAQSPAKDTSYAVVERGANHRLWQKTIYETGPDGHSAPRIHSYLELAAGLTYQNDSGQWMDSEERIETFAGGAIVRRGQHQVIFANNLNSYGAIDQKTPDGQRIRSHVMGLMYNDPSTGKAAMIARLQDSEGQLISPNKVLYRNAFSGVKADVQYTYKKGSFEQDVILIAQPPAPENYGMNPDTTELEVVTEFIDSPTEKLVNHSTQRKDKIDQDIDWGTMRIAQGRAFKLGKNAGKATSTWKQFIRIKGRPTLLEKVLVPDVASGLAQLPQQASNSGSGGAAMGLADIELPEPPPVRMSSKPMKWASITPSEQGFVLDYIEINTSQTNFTFQGDFTYYISDTINLVGVTTLEGGAVIKYNTNNSSALNILGTVQCLTGSYKPAIFTTYNDDSIGEPLSVGSEGACTGTLTVHVVNEISDNVDIYLYDDYWNTLVSDTIYPANYGEYSFTAGYDQHFLFYAYDPYTSYEYYQDLWPSMNMVVLEIFSKGEVGVTEDGDLLCTPPTVTPTTALALANGGNIHDIRICNLAEGINSSANLSVTDSQFVNCQNALDSSATNNVSLKNALFSQCAAVLACEVSSATVLTAENITADVMNLVNTNAEIASALRLTNSILLCAASSLWATATATNSTVINPSETIFQTVGGGSYYLTNNSSYRDAGTTNISPALIADLQKKTTYPPIVYNNGTISVSTNFVARAIRDTALPDLGYHYDPIDDVFGEMTLATNTTLNLGPGTVLGWYRQGGGGAGLWLLNGSQLNAAGTATSPCAIAHFNLVQEGNGNWVAGSWGSAVMFYGNDAVNPPKLNCNFTHWYNLNYSSGADFRDYWAYGAASFVNCEFNFCCLSSYKMSSFNFTNCLFFREDSDFWDQSSAPNINIINCTFYNGCLALCRYSYQAPTQWTIKNTVFDGTTFVVDDYYGGSTNHTTFDYNAYNTNNLSWQTYPFVYPPLYGTLETLGANDLKVPNYNWQTSWFGNFFLPTNSLLINKGDQTANLIGLYHFTTQTNQVKETNSVVDLGYHSVATDAYGLPLDSDGDGLPDYIEDNNGNGLDDIGEMPWDIASTGMKLWLRSDVGTTLFTSNQVSAWADQSSNSNHATQIKSYDQPLWITNSINGLPTIWFSGTNGNSYTNGYLNLPNNLLTGSTGAEAFVVLKTSAAKPASRMSLWELGTDAINKKAFPDTDGSIKDDFASSAVHNMGVPPIPINEYNIYQVSSQTNNFTAWLNGNLFYHTNVNTVQLPITGNWISSEWNPLGYSSYYDEGELPDYFAGNIAEILVFNRALTDAERSSVNTYLINRYGLAPSIVIFSPTNHSVFPTGANINLSVSAFEGSGGSIKRVQFLQGTNSIGIVSNSPWSMTWSNVAAGSTNLNPITLSFIATGSNELFTTTSILINVDPPPTISITNLINPAYIGIGPTNILIRSSASSASGIQQVQFYQGATNLGTIISPPYNWNWTNLNVGSYVLDSVAVGNDGLTTTSSIVNVIIDEDTDGDGIGDYREQRDGLNPDVPDSFGIWLGSPNNIYNP